MSKFELTTTYRSAIFPEEPDVLHDPGENFIEACKYAPSTLARQALPPNAIEVVPAFRNSVPRSTKFYQGVPTVALPKPKLPQTPIDEIIRRRRTRYAEVTASITLQTLTNILHGAYGVTGKVESIGIAQRAVPSAGAMYPLDLYWVSQKVEGIENGLYHYNPLRHQFEVLNVGDEPGKALRSALVQPEMYKEKVGHLIVTSAFGRTRFKYGTRGYRFALLEAGHVAQSVVMLSEAHGMLAACLGGYYDDQLDAMLRLDGINETSIYVIALSRVP